MVIKTRLILFSILCLLSQSRAFNYHDQGYQYLNPLPESQYNSPLSTIIIRFNRIAPQDITNLNRFITVTGSDGTVYHGITKIAGDNRTVIFSPATEFNPGEIVQVHLSPVCYTGKNGLVTPLSYRFAVSSSGSIPIMRKDVTFEPDKNSATSNQLLIPCSAFKSSQLPANGKFDNGTNAEYVTSLSGHARVLVSGVSIPSDFPFVTVTINDNPDTGYIFLDNWNGPPYNIILDNTGRPIWYMRTPDQRRDFKVQENGLITMMVRQGYSLPLFGWGYIAFDQTYTEVDTFCAANGWGTDEHELQVLKDGHYLLVAIKEVKMDVSEYIEGGHPSATVRLSCLQEFTPEHEMIFQWASLDHYDIHDLEVDNPRSSYFRFTHMNAISIDDDDNILVSNRHLSEVTKIDRNSGDIIWRLGGAHNQFTFVNDELNGFRNPHDIRALGNGHYTVFDNGNLHDPPESRAVEYVLDTVNMTATMVWEFRDHPAKYSSWMGNVQRLPNGNTLINWADGSLPKLTEVRPNGEKAFEMWFNKNMHCYRVFRCRWKGAAKQPYLIVEAHKECVNILCNKFGDRDVAFYRIYGGTSENPTTLLDTSRTTFKSLTRLTNRKTWYFRVSAVNHHMQESAFSNEESALVNFIPEGSNMVINGEFSKRLNWYLQVVSPALATWSVYEGIGQLNISEGGTQSYQILFLQEGMELIRGAEYIFEFDAWSDAPRVMDVYVLMGKAPNTIYGEIGAVALSTRQKHFNFEFLMKEPSDFNACIVYCIGGSGADVFLDNVSLKKKMPEEEPDPVPVPEHYQLLGNYPNPFSTNTDICFTVPQSSHVRIELYNLLGQLQQKVCDSHFEPGTHTVNLDCIRLSTGIYFYSMTAFENNRKVYSAMQKALLVK